MIRELQPQDWNRLAWIDRLRTPAFHWTREELQKLAASHQIWILESDKEIVAWVAWARLSDAFEITALATHPDFQKRGHMRQLLSELINTKRQELEIWLEVHEANRPAVTLYEALGFTLVGRRPRYYSDGGTALLFTRK